MASRSNLVKQIVYAIPWSRLYNFYREFIFHHKIHFKSFTDHLQLPQLICTISWWPISYHCFGSGQFNATRSKPLTHCLGQSVEYQFCWVWCAGKELSKNPSLTTIFLRRVKGKKILSTSSSSLLVSGWFIFKFLLQIARSGITWLFSMLS